MPPLTSQMSSRYVTAFEHERIPISSRPEYGITTSEADLLLEIANTRRGFAQRYQTHVSLAQYCGVVAMGDRVLEVLPKIADGQAATSSREILLRLLGMSGVFPLFRDQRTGHSLLSSPILEVFIAAFFDETVTLVRGGLLQKYVFRRDDLGFVRGRIQPQIQFGRNANRTDRVSCIYDELTIENEWNQIINTGLAMVRPWLRNPELIRRWNELRVIFRGIGETFTLTESLRRLVYGRAETRYRSVVEWIKWIDSTLSPSASAGVSNAPGLLLDMNALFERALAAFLGNRSTHFVSQDSTRFLARRQTSHKGVYRLRPDFLFRKNGKVFAIADAKWKKLRTNENGFLLAPAGDINQMQAYSIAYGCSNLALIYPWHAGLKHSRETSFELSANGKIGPVIDILCVDVESNAFPILRGDPQGPVGRLFQNRTTLVA